MGLLNNGGFLIIITLIISDYCTISKAQSCIDPSVSVQTNYGLICGMSTQLKWADRPDNTVHMYKGIPFARPPIGSLRFRKPVALSPDPKRTIIARDYKPSCYQYNDTNYITNPGAKMWVSQVRYDEDCLYLNVWVPQQSANPINSNGQTTGRNKKELLAVMVWIYGGSFALGTSSLEVYEGRYLAGRQNVIVVSMNYRLGPFGFLFLDHNEVPGNMGLWDQRLAIKWVKDNILKFGGDPERITIFGESAGAVSVSTHVVSPWSQNLFTNAIMQSGSLLSYWGATTKPVAFARSKDYAVKLNCQRASAVSLANCMRHISPERLIAAHSDMYDIKAYFSVPFPPVIDNVFLPKSNEQEFKKFAHLKPKGALMMGVNKNEGSFFLFYTFISNSSFSKNQTEIKINKQNPFNDMIIKVLDENDDYEPTHIVPLVNFEYTDFNVPDTNKEKIRRLEEMSSDRSFKCPLLAMVHTVTNKNRRIRGIKGESPTLPTYFYDFRYRTKSLPWPEWMGAIHGIEIDFVFGVPFNENFQRQFYRFTDHERKISDHVMQYWTNFARRGDPNLSPRSKSTGKRARTPRIWPEFENLTQSYLVINEDGQIITKTHPLKRKCSFWLKWYPTILTEDMRLIRNSRCRR